MSFPRLSLTECLMSKIFGVPVKSVKPLCVFSLFPLWFVPLALCVPLTAVGRPSEFPGGNYVGSYGNHGQSLPIPVPTQLQNYQRMEQNLHSTKQDGSPRFVVPTVANEHFHFLTWPHFALHFVSLGCQHQCAAAAVGARWALLGLGLRHPTGRERSPPIAGFLWEAPDPSSSPLKVAQRLVLALLSQAQVTAFFHCFCSSKENLDDIKGSVTHL